MTATFGKKNSGAPASFGKAVGDVATVNGVDWEIVGLR